MAGEKKKSKELKGPQSSIAFRIRNDMNKDVIDSINKHYLNGNLGEYINNALKVYDLLERQNLLPLILQSKDEQNISPTNIAEEYQGKKENTETEEIITTEVAATQEEKIIDTSKYKDAEDEIFGGGYEKPKTEKERVNFIKKLQENMEKAEKESLGNNH